MLILWRSTLVAVSCLLCTMHLIYCSLVDCTSLAMEACQRMSSSVGCDISEVDFNVESNLCKRNSQFQQVINKYEDGHLKMYLCDIKDLDYNIIHAYARNMLENKMMLLVCEDSKASLELGIGLVLVKSGYPEEAVRHFNRVIEMQSEPCAALFYGRAQAYTKLGISHGNNADMALSDYSKALQVTHSDQMLPIYEARAEVFSALGRRSDAYSDYTEAIKLKPTFRLFLLRGIALVFMERYRLAYDDLQASLRLQPQQSTAMHYLAMCLFHMGRLEEAIKTFEAILVIKPENTDIMQSLAQAYREIGDFDSAIKYLKKATVVDPTNARLLQSKADLLYNHGNVAEALTDYKSCVSLEPYNNACQYMKASCYATMGQFYPAVKELIKTTKDVPMQTVHGVYDYPYPMFLREWCRYLHSHLDLKIEQFDLEDDVNIRFKEKWARAGAFIIQNYTEQPGLQPQIKDLTPKPYNKLPRKTQKLLCHAHQLGRILHLQGAQYGEGRMGNIRVQAAAGLASLEVAQTVSEFWKSPKAYRNKHDKKFTWRDAFEIAAKWLRFADVDSPVFWIDKPELLSKRYVHRIGLIQSNITKLKYEQYLPKFYKAFVEESVKSDSHARYDDTIEALDNLYQLYKTEKRERHKKDYEDLPYIVASTKISSKKDQQRKTLDGCSLLLSMDSEDKLMLILDLHLSRGRTMQYHDELDFIWQKLSEENKKASAKTSTGGHDSLINLIITLSYYVINLFPLSRSSGIISHSTAVGLILALGRETTGKIAGGKTIHMEALTIYDHEKFRNLFRSWFSFKKAPVAVNGLDSVANTFPTFRTILQALSYDLTHLCKDL